MLCQLQKFYTYQHQSTQLRSLCASEDTEGKADLGAVSVVFSAALHRSLLHVGQYVGMCKCWCMRSTYTARVKVWQNFVDLQVTAWITFWGLPAYVLVL